MNTVSPPLPAADDLETHRLILRDGSVAIVVPPVHRTGGRCGGSFTSCSPESRRHRFFIAGEAPDAVVDRFCAAADPAESLTLIACRLAGDDERIVAAASYFRMKRRCCRAPWSLMARFGGSSSRHG